MIFIWYYGLDSGNHYKGYHLCIYSNQLHYHWEQQFYFLLLKKTGDSEFRYLEYVSLPLEDFDKESFKVEKAECIEQEISGMLELSSKVSI